MKEQQQLEAQIKKLPYAPGVYLFKDARGVIVYVGKAKSLRKRVSNYLQRQGRDMRVDAILGASVALEHLVTTNEVEAMLLEAQLIQAHQPKCNVLLKSGQPFLYILITADIIPDIKLVRQKKKRGSYFGPFLEKGAARKVYDFLVKTFRLQRCGKKIKNGCLYFHMGQCAGFCRDDADVEVYKKNIEFARAALKKGHAKFLIYLQEEIAKSNYNQTFEYSRKLHDYLMAFQKVYGVLDTRAAAQDGLLAHHIWFWDERGHLLFLFEERSTQFKQKAIFHSISKSDDEIAENMASYYRVNAPTATILINFELDTNLWEAFLSKWHELSYQVRIIFPDNGHEAALMRLARLHAHKEVSKQVLLPQLLQQMFLLPIAPRTIDCFDISHKQGRFMVGSCVRFKDGKPDKNNSRKFYIKSVDGIDDYASLKEVVNRRYKDSGQLPDLVLIDGGKGQLNAVRNLIPEGRCISLAKREEIVFTEKFPDGKKLDIRSFVGQALIALRDYAHHFALSFHRHVERSRQET